MNTDSTCDGLHAIASHDGRFIAFTQNQQLHKRNVTSRQQQLLARLTPSSSSNTTGIKWSRDSNHILLVQSSGLQVFNSDSGSEIARFQNGTGSHEHISLADFIGNSHVLVVWEFGRGKLLDLSNGKALDLSDLKSTCDGWPWQIRPGKATPQLFALLSRMSNGDQLSLHFPTLDRAIAPVKLPTIDCQSLSWSPNGRWLAVLDVPTATPNLYIYTPDGHLFRSYPSTKTAEPGFGIKSLSWSSDGQKLALSRYDGKVELLNTRTFSAIAMIEHTTTINQHSLTPADKAPIWLENVAASGDRSYSSQSQPFAPPLSKMKPDAQPRDHGIAEMHFNSDGRYLATRDCRMLNTIWIWDMSTLAAHTILIQHANVRSLHWHHSHPDILLIDCAEGFAHIHNVSSTTDPPDIFPTHMRPKASIKWLQTSNPTILMTEKTRFGFLFPNGRDNSSDFDHESNRTSYGIVREHNETPDAEIIEDSIFEILSSRKPLPPKTEPSYTEMVDLQVNDDDMQDDTFAAGGPLEDTFREKRKSRVRQADVVEDDPFDDSQIF